MGAMASDFEQMLLLKIPAKQGKIANKIQLSWWYSGEIIPNV